MKTLTLLLLLLGATASLSATAAAPRVDEPSAAKEQPKKTVKPKQNRVPLFNFRKKKESSYTRAMRRNELLR
jgi:V8-like Glu-specific endopeptidase